MRVYLPATLPLLAEWRAARAASLRPAGPGQLAYAVTPALREWYREADADELEHAAQVAAAVGSLELIAGDPGAPKRRVVLAVDVDDAAVIVAAGNGRAAVTLTDEVPITRWGSALVDDAEAVPVVEAVLARLAAAARDPSDPGLADDASFALGEAESHELGWYAVQELPYL
jgi:hypothetical protein